MTEPLPSAHLFTHEELSQRELSSAEQVDHLVARRGAVDSSGPGLNTLIELNPEAMTIAMELDAEVRDGVTRGPLHGLTIAVKDNIDTADAMLTTAGSLALADTRPSRDAALISRLRAAGLVVLGKANMSEWANLRSPHSTSGWSARGGLTRNPWDPMRSAGGSSSGSAAAVAAGVAPLAVGTETDGSIICPASYNGVVGIKPTVGLLSTVGIIPVSHSQDAPGPMARSVRLVAALLDAMAGTDHFLTACEDVNIAGVRVGVVRDHFGAHTGADAVTEKAIDALATTGAVIVDPVPAVAFPEPNNDEDDQALAVLLHEFQHGLTAYLSTRPPGGPRTLAEIVAFNHTNADAELTWFGQEYLERAALLPGLDSSAYQTARANTLRMAREDGLDAVFGAHEVDVLVSPAFPPAPVNDLVLGDSVGPGGECTTASAIAGYPILSVPIGFVHGLPVGLAITGPANSEQMLLRVARALEAQLGLLDAGALVPPTL
ncbi:MAG: amidase [Actinomycetia bacterium]|nr:amidase [Actinomycetes bacterium]